MNGGKSEKMQAFSSLKVQTVLKKQAAASNSRRRGTSPSMFFLTWPAIPELSGYRVSSRSAGKEQIGQKTFAFREGAEEQGNNRTKQK